LRGYVCLHSCGRGAYLSPGQHWPKSSSKPGPDHNCVAADPEPNHHPNRQPRCFAYSEPNIVTSHLSDIAPDSIIPISKPDVAIRICDRVADVIADPEHVLGPDPIADFITEPEPKPGPGHLRAYPVADTKPDTKPDYIAEHVADASADHAPYQPV